MAAAFDHNKLLKKIAKGRLGPHGIIQVGNSRTFLYDKAWYTIVIEFQSSSWSKGTYLNIGADFNFYPRDYFAFAYGSREKNFEPASSEKQFEEIVNAYCDFTIEKVEELKQKFSNVWAATSTFKKQVDDDSWDYFVLGILYGLTGNLSKAKRYLSKVKNEKCEYDYEFERQKLTIEMISWLEDDHVFLAKIKELINKTRQLKKLPLADLENIRNRDAVPQGVASGSEPGNKTVNRWDVIKRWFGHKN